MTSKLSLRIIGLALCCAAAALSLGTTQGQAQSVVVMVNGEPITNFDIDQRSKLNRMSHKADSRQQVLEDLIDEKVKIKEAKKYGVNPSDSDIDSSFSTMASRMRMSTAQMTNMLAAQGIRPDTRRPAWRTPQSLADVDR